MVCAFALLHVVHSVSSCPYSLATWLHKACIIFVSFLTDFHGYVITLVVIKGASFLCCHLHCHFHRCAVIFSHSMMMLKYRNKVLYRPSRPLSNSLFSDDLSICCWRTKSNGCCLSFSLKWLHRLNSLHICTSWIAFINEGALCIIGYLYINNSLHLARKYARIFVRGHYLFREANSFPRAKFEKNCEPREQIMSKDKHLSIF